MVKRLFFLLKKEFIIEYRINRTFVFIAILSAASIFIISYVLILSGFKPDYNLIFWITLFFIVFTGIDKIFRYETEHKNIRFILQYYSCEEIVFAKFMFNFFAVMFTEIIIFSICCFFNNFYFLTTPAILGLIVFSSFSISASTIFSALISAKSSISFIFSISVLPVIFPLVMVLFKINIFSGSGVTVKEGILILLYGIFYLMLAVKLSPFLIKED